MKRVLPVCVLLLWPAVSLAGEKTPSYARQVQPFFTRYCVECHNTKDPEGGLSLENFKQLMEGGSRGAALVPGKPAESRLVRMIEGKLKPTMPPRKAKQPPAADVALVRAWVLAGAHDDSTTTRVVLPAIAPKVKRATPITAVAYSPDGKMLAASGRGEVLIFAAATGDLTTRLPAGRDRVTAIRFSPKGDTLAVAASTTGEGHEVRLWKLDGKGAFAGPGVVAVRHDDVVQDLAFSPDGTILATASYDRLIRLHDVAANRELRTLRDHSDSVYGISFHPGGKLLASGGADRAVKVWEVQTGNRLYTLGESNDWVYAVAWSPDGKHLAAAGVDRSIRVWNADASGGRIAHSVFAHEGAVLRLVYSPDGMTLFSLGEDRIVKSWHTAKMVEQKVHPRQAEAALSLAVRGDLAEFAVGLYDGTLRQIEASTGAVHRQPLPIKPVAPVLEKINPTAAVRGRTVEVTLTGKHLQGAEVVSSVSGVGVSVVSSTAGSQRVKLSLPMSLPPGPLSLTVRNEAGQSKPQSLNVDRFAVTAEAEPNDSPRTGQPVTLPATIVGTVGRAGDLDWFRFEAKVGQEVGVEALTAAVGSKLSPVLRLVDPAGNIVAESVTGHLGHVCTQAGVWSLGIRDVEYRGGSDFAYRLSVGEVPVVTAFFPTGVQSGKAAEIHVEGVHLGKQKSVRVEAPATSAPGSRLPVKLDTPLGPPLGTPSVIVGEFPDISPGKEMTIPVPGTANGRITEPGATQTWRFQAKKGQRLILEVNASRMGSPLDSTLEILDSTGRPLPRATLRCLARTYTVFRDVDSRSPGIRIEAWSELAVNDYLLVGNELVRIRALPRNPDDDCQFFSEQGQRQGFLGTTPVFQSLGSPMYKVGIHPPGTTFPPNGLPVATLYWRNDDGGPGMGKDSRLVFDPPADGVYQLRVGDARGEASPAHAYRLTVRPPRPDFNVRLTVPASVSRGEAVPVRAEVTRTDEFDGMIDLTLSGLPAGFSAPATNIPAGENSTAFSLYAEADAAAPMKLPAVTLTARAKIGDRDVVRTATGTLPKLTAPGDIVTTTEQKEVTITPGGETRITVKIERRNGFAGRIPLEVQGLPHGVRVLDVGLNGILITQAESARTFVLYCEPWVQAMNHPIVVLAKREGRNTEHAARSVLLKVTR